jgi:hypothetical protein
MTRSPSKALLLLSVVGLLLSGGCGVDSGPTTSNGVNNFAYPVSVAPQIKSLAVNTSQIFTATTAAPVGNVTWSIPPSNNASGSGSPQTQNGGYTFTYTAPAFPPLYVPGSPYQQGMVTLTTSTGASETTSQTFVITAPTVSVGFLTQPTTVALGASVTLFAYAVGNTNQGLSMVVNGIVGGNSTVGTIVPYTGAGATYGEYVYTAPAGYPVTGTTITIMAISAFDKTQSATLILTLT